MRCPHCGQSLPAGTDRCGRCAAGNAPPAPPGREAGDSPPRGARARAFRLVTSLFDRAADPAMVDELPPPGASGPAPGAGPADELGSSGRESIAGDRIAEDEPVTPGEVMAAPRTGTPPSEEMPLNARSREQDRTDAAGVDDFGEAREVPAPPAGETKGSPGPEGGGWGQHWESELRAEVRRAAPPRGPRGGFWVRLAALWIDGLFLGLVGSIVFAVLFSATGLQALVVDNLEVLERDPSAAMEVLRPALEPHLGVIALTYFGVSLFVFLYRPVCHAAWGRTLGKLIFGLRVVRTDGSPLGAGRAFLRYVGYIISLVPFGLGCIWAAWDRQKQGWHDKLAGTYVIKERG